MCNRKVFIKIIEVLMCIACVVTLRVTDDESRRLFNYLRYRSREWFLLNNVTWGAIGAAFATATCGGYVIITAGLLIAAISGELRGRKTELFLLGLGVILFGIVGALALASIENVPNDLVDNAAVLGALCIITALLFIADLLMTSSEQNKNKDGNEILVDKHAVKPLSTLTIEKEGKSLSKVGHEQLTKLETDKNNDENANKLFEKVGGDRRTAANDSDDKNESQVRTTDVGISPEPNHNQPSRDIKFIDAEKQRSEYINDKNHLKDAIKYRDAETMARGRFPDDRENDGYYYRGENISKYPSDELDTPRFPLDKDFPDDYPKIVNPSIKVMEVDWNGRQNSVNHRRYRYSDTSQYDNAHTRVAPGIHQTRDPYSFSSKVYRSPNRSRDEIEMLEEWVGILRKSTTGTQTTPHLPSSPNDPGYVKHTASNWPRDFKIKTPGSSPNREDH